MQKKLPEGSVCVSLACWQSFRLNIKVAEKQQDTTQQCPFKIQPSASCFTQVQPVLSYRLIQTEPLEHSEDSPLTISHTISLLGF